MRGKRREKKRKIATNGCVQGEKSEDEDGDEACGHHAQAHVEALVAKREDKH